MINTCKFCGKEIKRKKAIYCSYACRDKGRKQGSREIRKCIICNSEFEVLKKSAKKMCSDECRKINNRDSEVNKKRMKTLKKSMLKKYGIEHSFQTQTFINKSKKTKLERYGDENYVNVEKGKNTKLKKYGDATYNNVEKSKNTKLKKYGDVNYNNRPKFKKTMFDTYGGETTWASPELIEKCKKTIKEKYGVDHVLQSPEIQQKVKETNILKYGYPCPMNSPKIIEKTKKFQWRKTYQRFFTSNRLKNKIVPLFTVDEYKGSRLDYKFKCIQCGNEFEGTLKSGRLPRCLKCYPRYISSVPEKEVFSFVESILPNVEVIANTRQIITPKELDIYIPSKKIAIEFNGLYWHSELNGKDKNYHLSKTRNCRSKGIRLIHIFEDEWFYKEDIVKTRLKHILGVSTNTRIHTRSVVIKNISSSIKNSFLERHHIQGKDNSSIKLGAFYKDELVSVMTFSKPRIALGQKNTKEGTYEISRFCLGDYNLPGMFNKFISYFEAAYNPINIYSYIDNRWDTGVMYINSGFKKVSDGTPSYHYVDEDLNRYHRFNFAKHTLKDKLCNFDSTLTEWQNMQLAGYDRIWDVGSTKFVK